MKKNIRLILLALAYSVMANLIHQEHIGDIAPTDSNNNCAQKCYSLRPRLKHKRVEDVGVRGTRTNIIKVDSVGVRGTNGVKLTNTKGRQHNPLSKYRRKTANARERSRMREINEAFETLRKAIPHVTSSRDNQSEKTTKISTLKLAMDYIRALRRVLQRSEEVDVYNNFTEDFGRSSFISNPGHLSLPSTTYHKDSSQDHSITPSDHSLSSTSDVSDLLLISVDLEGLSKELTSAPDRTHSSLEQTFGVLSFQDQCSVFDENLFLTSTS